MSEATAEPSLFERLGGVYGIAGAVDVLVDRLYDNASANQNEAVAAFHAECGHAGFKFLVTAWSIEKTGGPSCYPGRDMTEAHAHLGVSEHDFDVVALEIAATLSYVGVPPQEHQEFMDIIESYRAQVKAPEGEAASRQEPTGTSDADPGQAAGVAADVPQQPVGAGA